MTTITTGPRSRYDDNATTTITITTGPRGRYDDNTMTTITTGPRGRYDGNAMTTTDDNNDNDEPKGQIRRKLRAQEAYKCEITSLIGKPSN